MDRLLRHDLQLGNMQASTMGNTGPKTDSWSEGKVNKTFASEKPHRPKPGNYRVMYPAVTVNQPHCTCVVFHFTGDGVNFHT